MKKSSYDPVMYTDFFKRPGFEIEKIEDISDNKKKITSKDGSYVFGLYSMSEYNNIKKENYINQKMKAIGIEPLTIYEFGVMPDIDKSYKIFEYRKEQSLRDFLDTNTPEDNYELGKKLGSILKKLHQLPVSSSISWHEEFDTKINYLFYVHYVNDCLKDSDYILVDFINANKHLTKNTPINNIYSNISDKNIRVYDDAQIDLRAIKENEVGDGIYDFVEINRIAIDNPEFARASLDGYFGKENPPLKFFRLLALYEAFTVFESLVNIRQGKDSKLSAKEIEKIMEMYDDFNQYKPKWLED